MHEDLLDRLSAIMLWESGSGFVTEFANWEQMTVDSQVFKMTLLPGIPDVGEVINRISGILEKRNLPNTLLGTSWVEVAERISDIVNNSLRSRSRMNARAKNISTSNLKIENEYDFQSLIYLALKPWLPELSWDPIMVVFDGQTKEADLSIHNKRVVIEAKHIRNADNKREILKTLDSLARFYLENPQLEVLIFLILVDPAVSVETQLLEATHSDLVNRPRVILRVLENR